MIYNSMQARIFIGKSIGAMPTRGQMQRYRDNLGMKTCDSDGTQYFYELDELIRICAVINSNGRMRPRNRKGGEQ